MSNNSEQSASKGSRPWFKKKRFIIPGAAILLILFFSIGSANGKSTSNEATQTQPTEQASTAPATDQTPDIKTQAGLKAAILKSLGTTTNRDVPKSVGVDFDGRDLYVQFALDDNFTNKMMITGAWKSTEKVIKLAQESGLVDNLTVNGTYAFQDKLGNPLGERAVFTANFLENSIPKINTGAFTGSMYADVATSVIIHPDFQ